MKKTSLLEYEISQETKYKNLYFHYDINVLRKKIQPAFVKMLKDFDCICRENGIEYRWLILSLCQG